MESNFNYYKLQIKLIDEMLGTCPEASIYNQHILKKTQKMIEEANKLASKAKKAYEKFTGVELPPDQEIKEIQGVIRRYQEIMGRKEEIPNDMDRLLSYTEKLKLEFDEKVAKGEEQRATCFMRDRDGHPMISTHMILGNLKENLKIIVNNGDKSILKTKVSVQEVLTLDVKPVDKFVRPSCDINRLPDGTPKLCERPIRFERMGKQEVSIALSEVLPAGAEFTMMLRVRKDSPMTKDALWKLFDLGKSNGLGQWHGSGGKGQYVFKLELDEEYHEQKPDGWN